MGALPVKRAMVGDLALYRVKGGFAFAVVTAVDELGFARMAERGASAASPRNLRGRAVAVGSASECTFDVPAFVEATPQVFDTPQDAQRAARPWMQGDTPASRQLDAAIAKAGAS